MVLGHSRLRASFRPVSPASLYEVCLGQTPIILRNCVVCAIVKKFTWFAIGLSGMFGNVILKYDYDMKIQTDCIVSECDSLIINTSILPLLHTG